MYRWLFVAALLLPSAACASGRGRDEPLPIMALPSELRERFVQHALAGKPSRKQRLERTVDFVLGARGMGMHYEDGATHTVEQAWATRRANCLGFTLLFLALAREAGLEAWPQAYEETLAWHRTDRLVYRSSHVNVGVRVGPRTFTLDAARGDVVTRGEPVRLTLRQLQGRYHNNLAVQAMKEGDLETARGHMAAALELDGRQASHWSNAGVLALHGGDAPAARALYDKALAMDADNTNALFNLVNMARRDGDAVAEAQFRERLGRVQQKDPFHHFLQAIDLELAGDHRQAVVHYREAIRLHGRDHRFHAALAGALERSGDAGAARKALRRAIALSEGTARDAYRERLRTLPAQ